MFATTANLNSGTRPALWLPILALSLYFLLSPEQANSAEATLCPSDTTARSLPTRSEAKHDEINISADSSLASTEGDSVFQGNVVIEQHLRRILTDHAEYNDEQQEVSLNGNIQVNNTSMDLSAQRGHVDLETGNSKFDQVDFNLRRSGLRGHAQSIQIVDNSSELRQAFITSCTPEDNSWRMDADNIQLNHQEEYGSAEDVVLRFKGLPFFYTPYIEFPLGERRRSGLLIPAFGDSSSRGFEMSIPWYWNIAPNHDAILAPHYMSRRGTQLDTQYRFLTESSEGELAAAYLNNDEITGERRHQIRYQQHSDITTGLKLDLDIQDVSDANYFNDFSNDVTGASTTHLDRSADLLYTHAGWRARFFAQTFETVDSTIALADRPYRSLPQLSLDGKQAIGNSPIIFSLGSEWVNYDHEDDTLITGSRATLKPGLALPMKGAYWFATPALSHSITDYDVEDGSGTALALEQRRLTTSSLDAGLFFERSLSNDLVQTLEPRLYYLNVPYTDQSSLPLFDTSIPDFSFAQLFRDNRFNGGDRIGDANQLTLALSSGFLNPATGNEALRASLGQIIYFDDRRVTLSGIDETRSGSASIAEISGSWLHWRSSASVQWDSVTRRSEKQNFLLHYQSDEHYAKNSHIFNIGYRMRDDGSISDSNIEQSDISFVSPISNEYALFGRWNYSIKDKRDIDVIGGLSYDSCCWAIQLLAQRRLNTGTLTAEYDNSVMVQLVLKGLGSVSGDSVNTTLSRAIPGYSED